jgi:hypothetical protein
MIKANELRIGNIVIRAGDMDDQFGVAFTIIKYVHQLQNLIFVLTGEELQVAL